MPLKSIPFSAVPLGGWFKDSSDGCWHLKVDASTGAYQRFGTRYTPRFSAADAVLVE